MAYLTVASVKEQYPSLKEQIDRGTVASARVERWISQSESLIDSYIAQRYEIPFADNPPLVVALAYEVFEYFWQKDVYTPTSSGDEVPWLYARYDRILKILNQIATGLLSLFDNSNKKISPSPTKLKTIRSNHQKVNQLFSMKESWEQKVDSEYDKEPTF